MRACRPRIANRIKIDAKGCWNWLLFKDRDGYGTMTLKGKKVRAHRAYYEEKFGPIPVGLTIDHLCRNRSCVNPDHLEAVTQGENIKRGNSGKRPQETCINGHSMSEYAIVRKDGKRYCRLCANARDQKARAEGRKR